MRALRVPGMLTVLLFTQLQALPAFANAIPSPGATDAFSATPVDRGHTRLDARLDFTQGAPWGVTPAVAVLTGPLDGWEMGVGTGFNASFSNAPLPGPIVKGLFAYGLAALPWKGDRFRSAIAFGAPIPVAGGTGEFAPGAVAVLGGDLGPLTAGLNVGASRGMTSGTTVVSGNLNFAVPVGDWTLYEEQAIDDAVGAPEHGAFRLMASTALRDDLTADVSVAERWDDTTGAIVWTFNPNLGITYTF